MTFTGYRIPQIGTRITNPVHRFKMAVGMHGFGSSSSPKQLCDLGKAIGFGLSGISKIFTVGLTLSGKRRL